MIGVWDDHDYGVNDGDKDFVNKVPIREMFLDFVDEPLNSERRNEKDSPIHQDYIIQKDGVSIHIILLDNRYEFDFETNDRLG